jgi:hypothetical protein
MKAKAQGQEGNDDVQCILKWIHRHRPESFSLRDLNHDLSKTFGKRPQSLEEALSWLVRHNCIRLPDEPAVPKGRRGRRPSTVYLVNPHVISSQNGQNRPSETVPAYREEDFDNYGNSAEATAHHDGEEAWDEFSNV